MLKKISHLSQKPEGPTPDLWLHFANEPPSSLHVSSRNDWSPHPSRTRGKKLKGIRQYPSPARVYKVTTFQKLPTKYRLPVDQKSTGQKLATCPLQPRERLTWHTPLPWEWYAPFFFFFLTRTKQNFISHSTAQFENDQNSHKHRQTLISVNFCVCTS